MSVFTSSSSNRLLKSNPIRSGTTTVRQNYVLSSGTDIGSAPESIVNFALRCLAVLGLVLAVYFFFRPAAPNLLAKLNDKASTAALVSANSGDMIIARTDGSLESMADGSETAIFTGDMIVAEDGIVHIDFTHGQEVALAPGTSVTVEQLELQNGVQRVQLVVWSGSVQYSTVGKRAAEDYFYVSSTSSSSTIDDSGTVHLEVVSPVETRYTMLDDGVATILMADQTLKLDPTQQLTATLGDPLIAKTMNPLATETESKSVLTVSEITNFALAMPQKDAPQKDASQAQTVPEQPILDTFTIPVKTHKVQPGDTLWSISLRYNIEVDAIMLANPDIVNATLLQVGQQIYIPTEFASTAALGTN